MKRNSLTLVLECDNCKNRFLVKEFKKVYACPRCGFEISKESRKTKHAK